MRDIAFDITIYVRRSICLNVAATRTGGRLLRSTFQSSCSHIAQLTALAVTIHVTFHLLFLFLSYRQDECVLYFACNKLCSVTTELQRAAKSQLQ